MIEKREQSWSYNREREEHMKNVISDLELENKRLREVLRTDEDDKKQLQPNGHGSRQRNGCTKENYCQTRKKKQVTKY